jgi:hypothetical protein
MLWMGIWVHPYTVTHVQVGGKFGKNGVWLNPNDAVVSWLRLQTASDCIPHPYWMKTKCFSTLICCGWAYRCTLTHCDTYTAKVGPSLLFRQVVTNT